MMKDPTPTELTTVVAGTPTNDQIAQQLTALQSSITTEVPRLLGVALRAVTWR